MDYVSLRKNKNFVLVFLGALVSNIGATLYSFAVSFYLLKLTNNNTVIQGSYLAVVGAVTLVFMLIGGVLADRYNKGKIMYLCDFIKGAILAITTLIMVFFTNTTLIITLLFVVGVLGSVVSGLFTPASSSLIPMIVREEDLQKANSYFALLNSAQAIIGIVLAGILYSSVPINVLFFVVAGCYIASGVSEIFIKYEHKKNEDKLTLKASLKEIGSGFKYVFANKTLLALTLTCLFLNFFLTPLSSNYLPFFIAHDVASSEYLFKGTISPEMWSSILEVILCAGMIIGSIIISLVKYKKTSKVIKTWITVLSCLFLVIATSNLLLNDIFKHINPYLIILCFVFLSTGLIMPSINVPATTSIQKITDKKMMGKVESFLNVGSSALTPLSSFLGGIIMSALGSSCLLFICAGGLLITSVLLIFNKPIRDL